MYSFGSFAKVQATEFVKAEFARVGFHYSLSPDINDSHFPSFQKKHSAQLPFGLQENFFTQRTRSAQDHSVVMRIKHAHAITTDYLFTKKMSPQFFGLHSCSFIRTHLKT